MSSILWVVPTVAAGLVYVVIHAAFFATLLRRRARRSHRSEQASLRAIWCPRVSVLKPLAGADDELAANLASFARSSYARFEILFGVASIDDAAVPVARAFIAANPGVDAKLVVTDPSAAVNPKVAQLIGLAGLAKGDVFVISDSNVRVAPAYLSDIVGALADTGVGIATSLIVGSGHRTLGALLENAQLNAYIAPLTVAAPSFSERRICIGKSMAMRKADLERLGGFAAVGDVLAEDDALGRKFLEAGYEHALSVTPIENRNVETSLRRTIDRHTRWAQMRRLITPGCYAVEPLLSPVVIALTTLVATGTNGALKMLLLAMLLQMLGATLGYRALFGRFGSWRVTLVEPLRALLLFGCWLRAWMSLRVTWRDKAYRLGKGSRLVPIAEWRRNVTVLDWLRSR